MGKGEGNVVYAEERRAHILAALEKRGTVHSYELAEQMGVSRETIRRDILELSNRGLLIKTHGGAISTGNGETLLETPYGQRESRNADEKKRLCAFAATLVRESDTIFVDNSTSCSYLLRYLPRAMRLTILTNSISLLIEAMKCNGGNWSVYSTGGQIKEQSMSLNGYAATQMLGQFSPAKAFMSCHGVNDQLMAQDHYMEDVEIKRLVLERSKRAFLLLDHSKINNTGVLDIAHISAFDHVIADSALSASVKRDIQNEKVYIDTV